MAEVRFPFLDLRPEVLGIADEVTEAVDRVMRSGRYLLGPEMERFESDFAALVGAPEAVAVGSGLDALLLTLRALDLPAGTGVAVPAHTFVATWFAVTLAGLRPVPVDVRRACLTMDPERLFEVVERKEVGCVVPVHLYGLPCHMAEIEAICDRAGIPVIYDAAQAHGATYLGAAVGARGTASCWSFYPG